MAEAETRAVTSEGDRPGEIRAVPVRHPGRWVAVAVIAVLTAMFVHLLLTNGAFDWSFILQAMVQSPVLRGLMIGTLLGTVLSMLVGVTVGITVAIMRLSENPILRTVAAVYTWFFRAVPRFVLLFIMGTLGLVFPGHWDVIGVPFGHWFTGLFGGTGNLSLFHLNANNVFSGMVGLMLGLGLSEGAYMAEIARAGILSVDDGQREAASALGMSPGLSMRRVILPQAMRVIVPPTGNETIAMLKDTSLVGALPFSSEMFFQLQAIGNRTYQPFAVGVSAVLWYLIVCTILGLIQSRLEKRFGRGYGAIAPRAQKVDTAKALGEAGGEPA